MKNCPYDFRFGIDIDYYDECEKCRMWEECNNEENRISRLDHNSYEYRLLKDKDYKEVWEELE